ncbi:MAG: hypothetical protein KC560_01595, partial [Myxococcales bacterium]|nr:hypothetical protein [Myxococcales bacterium]
MRDWLIKSVLLAWPLITVVVVSSARPAIAAASLMLGTILFLPTRFAFDFPLIPPTGREEIASLALFASVLFLHPRRILRIRPGLGVEGVVFLLMLASIGTALTNGDVLTYGPRILPRLVPYDAVSDAVRDFLRFFLPFVIGRAMFRSRRDLRDLLLVIVVAGLVYSALILIELRLSPQLNRWIYGFFPHSFHQHVRGGSYRPMVFMPNGLAVGQFMSVATLAAAGLLAARARNLPVDGRAATAYLGSMVAACKGYASIAYSIVGLGAIFFLRPRHRVALAAGLAALTATYPLLRSYDMFPTEELVSAASAVSAARAHSLDYRFVNEDILLVKAQERVLFGWGGYNRSRVYDERRGGNITITDGYWIIQLGQRGILGMILTFGLILIPVLVVYRRLPRVRDRSDASLLATLALIVALLAVDLLPNGLFTFLPIVLSGALLGTVQGIVENEARAARAPARVADRGAAVATAQGSG